MNKQNTKKAENIYKIGTQVIFTCLLLNNEVKL